MGTTKLLPNEISPEKRPSNSDYTPGDKSRLAPPKGYEKCEKILKAMREENRGRTKISKDDIPKEALEYLQNLYDPEIQPENFANWSLDEQLRWFAEYSVPYFEGLPESLENLTTALGRPGDNLRPVGETPEWLDMEKFRRGQKFAMDNFFAVSICMQISFFAIYTFKDSIKPIIFTKRSSTPYAAFYRYFKNIHATWLWYTGTPWEKGTDAYKMLQFTRKIHQSTMNVVRGKTPEELDEASTIKSPWCPMRELMTEEFRTVSTPDNVLQTPYVIYEGRNNRQKSFSQADMSVSTFGFVGLPLICPEAFGLKNAKEEDLEAFCHVWRTFGYLLGIEDEFNFCRGSLSEIRQRSRDVLEFWMKPNMKELTPEWEHLTRCMTMGITYFTVNTPYMSILLLLTDVMNMTTPRLRACVDWSSWIVYKLYLFYFYYLVNIPGVVYVINKIAIGMLLGAVKYSPEVLKSLKEDSDKIMLKNNIVL